MKQWQYRVMKCGVDNPQWQGDLDHYGMEGWELVAMIHDGVTVKSIFKRQVELPLR